MQADDDPDLAASSNRRVGAIVAVRTDGTVDVAYSYALARPHSGSRT